MSEVSACPHCDSTNWNPRNAKPGGNLPNSNHDYWCQDCKRGFSQLLTRPSKGHNGVSARRMLQSLGVDPEEAME